MPKEAKAVHMDDERMSVMYKIREEQTQLGFEDFNQPIGLRMNPDNRWIQKADLIPWCELEGDYAKLFKNDSKRGNVAKSFRMAFGALLIQLEYAFSDEETVLQIQENPYLQYFVGLPGYQEHKPFDSSTMVYFRKRLTAERVSEINERILASHETLPPVDSKKKPNAKTDSKRNDDDDDTPNVGTLMLDATCAPSQIKYPLDTDLLNDARLQTERMIKEICHEHGIKKPRTYPNQARKAHLAIAKMKKKSKSTIRKAVRKQLGYLTRNCGYLTKWQEQGISLSELQTIDFYKAMRILEQQQEMYDTRTHSVANRIVSFSQPFLRPIVRGKAKAATEFGVKLDISQANGFVRIERMSFDAFNESEDLIDAVERYQERTGYYPERVLVDQIYRTRDNREFCKKHHIRLSGPKLGRPKKDNTFTKKEEYQDNCDRIQVEREFSQAKRCHGLGLIRTKLATTTLTTIALSIVSLNLGNIQRKRLCHFFMLFISMIKGLFQRKLSSPSKQIA